jgi:hypothetical protein
MEEWQEFEYKVAKELQREGYDVEMQYTVQHGGMNRRLDVVAFRSDSRFKWVFIVCSLLFLTAISSFAVRFVGLNKSKNKIMRNVGDVAKFDVWDSVGLPVLLLIGVGGVALSLKFRKNWHYCIWIECKTVANGSTTEHVHKLISTRNEIGKYIGIWRKEYPAELRIYSKYGFQGGAVDLAIKHNVKCFESSGRKFQQVEN